MHPHILQLLGIDSGGIALEALTANDIIRILGIMCHTVEREKAYLSQLDCNVGDGDFGASLSTGFEKIKENFNLMSGISIGEVFKNCGRIIMDNCGGVTGPIWGGAFRAAGNFTQGKEKLNLSDLAEMLYAVVKRIKKQGGAEQGDKTLLDALIPAVESLKTNASKNMHLKQAAKEFAEAAKEGAESTKNIVAKKGRSRYLGERTLGHPDPGAMALSFLFQAVAEEFFCRSNDTCQVQVDREKH